MENIQNIECYLGVALFIITIMGGLLVKSGIVIRRGKKLWATMKLALDDGKLSDKEIAKIFKEAQDFVAAINEVVRQARRR